MAFSSPSLMCCTKNCGKKAKKKKSDETVDEDDSVIVMKKATKRRTTTVGLKTAIMRIAKHFWVDIVEDVSNQNPTLFQPEIREALKKA
jgi:hypothetical protein